MKKKWLVYLETQIITKLFFLEMTIILTIQKSFMCITYLLHRMLKSRNQRGDLIIVIIFTASSTTFFKLAFFPLFFNGKHVVVNDMMTTIQFWAAALIHARGSAVLPITAM